MNDPHIYNKSLQSKKKKILNLFNYLPISYWSFLTEKSSPYFLNDPDE